MVDGYLQGDCQRSRRYFIEVFAVVNIERILIVSSADKFCSVL